MNVRTIPRAAVNGYLKAIRAPFDAAASVVPGGHGRGAAARLAVDRADAAARAVAGTMLRDPQLREDARRRRTATRERERAANLRTRAEEKLDGARARTDESHEQAQRRRKQADARARTQRRRAEQEHEERTKKATASERQRKQAAREVKAEQDQQVAEVAPAARLDALQEQAQAEDQRQKALTEQEEAQRLGDAAAALKEERKDDAGTDGAI